MKKKTITMGALVTAVLAGGYISYVQIAPQTNTISETEKVAQHISLNYKLNLFGLTTTGELLAKLQQQDKDTKEFIYKKQSELGNLIREIEEKDPSLKDSFFESNKAKQIAYADTIKIYLSSGLAYNELNSKENRDKLLQVNSSLEDLTKDLLSIDEKVINKYKLTIDYSGKVDKESSSEKTKVKNSRGISISYKDGSETRTIDIK